MLKFITRYVLSIFGILLVLSVTLLSACGHTGKIRKTYGVFIGLSEEEVLTKATEYSLIVVDGQDISEGTIEKLKQSGHRVYGYLSIGSLEKYRPYYERFSDITLGEYDNWPDEYWLDVSDPEWQEYVTDQLASEMKDSGFDGFFLDNADVYYNYMTQDIYSGLKSILEGLQKYDLPIVINGGDTFVTRLMDEGKVDLIDAINQETVFSCILDYEKDEFGKQKSEDTTYYKEYIERAADSGLDVFLLEYTDDRHLISEIEDYCDRKGFDCYISGHVDLR